MKLKEDAVDRCYSFINEPGLLNQFGSTCKELNSFHIEKELKKVNIYCHLSHLFSQ